MNAFNRLILLIVALLLWLSPYCYCSCTGDSFSPT